MLNEFIVWDEDRKQFIKSYYNHNKFISIDGKKEVIEVEHNDVNEEGYVYDNKFKNCTIHNYIGKTDDTPEKNKIYADSSIVEFNSSYIMERLIGVFKWNQKRLQYVIETKHNLYDFRDFANLKVIGTLQENKELLDD